MLTSLEHFSLKALKSKKQTERRWIVMNPTLVLELVLIQTLLTVKNDHERSRSRPTLAKKADPVPKKKCAYQIAIDL